jgi:protocatechuate 3,4-dioxygenase beta subunit
MDLLPPSPRPTPLEHHELEDHDRGLAFDLATLVNRRRAFGLFAGVGAGFALAACGASGSTAAATSTTTAAGAGATTTTAAAGSDPSDAAACSDPIPEETGGPYPGDGTNGPNALTESGIVRSDITSSFGSSTTTAQGIPFTIELTVTDLQTGCNPLAGAAVYAWHCSREGEYSMYGSIADENYLRGVQETDSDGTVTFTTIFPAAYDGRWPHVHFEVYPSLSDATSAATPIVTSQLALPSDTCNLVYATEGYEASVKNFANVSLSTDGVFSDGWSTQVPTMSGDVASGFTGRLQVPVDSTARSTGGGMGGGMGAPPSGRQ